MAPSWVWPVAIAPFIGSFLSVVVVRAADPRSILWERSRCTACRHTLCARDLIPLMSWLVLRARCRFCAAPISVFYPLMEVAAVGVATWAALSSELAMWPTALLGWMLLGLAATDFKYYLLPDFLTIPLLAIGLATNWMLDRANISSYVIGAGAGFGFIVLLRFAYRLWRLREGIGLGDAKLLAGVGAWVSWQGLPTVVFLAALFGLSGTLLRSRGKQLPTLTERAPFGAYLCVALWVVWLYGPLQ